MPTITESVVPPVPPPAVVTAVRDGIPRPGLAALATRYAVTAVAA